MARKKRGKQKEEEAGEAWLLPYSDLMTLLLALFISLFAISQTDQKKVSDRAQAFSSAFNMGGPSMFDKMGPNPGRRAEMPSDEDLGNSAYIQENQSLEHRSAFDGAYRGWTAHPYQGEGALPVRVSGTRRPGTEHRARRCGASRRHPRACRHLRTYGQCADSPRAVPFELGAEFAACVEFHEVSPFAHSKAAAAAIQRNRLQ